MVSPKFVRPWRALLLGLLCSLSGWAGAQGLPEAGPAPAQPAAKAPSGPIIEDIKIEGVRRVEPAAVKLVLASKDKQPLDPAKVTEDLKAIFAMSYFSDVQAYTEPAGGGVRLIYVVKEKPSIRKINIEGNEAIKEEDIRSALTLRPFTILNERRVKQTAAKIRSLFNDKGYYLAEVDTKVEPLPDNQVAITFTVHENTKVEVRSIRFVGNHNIPTKVLKNGIETREGNLLSFLNDAGTYKKDSFKIDLMRITSAYFDRGFINVKVETPDTEISADRKYIYITIRIEEGEQFSVGKIGFQGTPLDNHKDFDLQEDGLTLHEGEIFNRSLLAENMMAMKTAYEDQGYAYVNITPQTRVHPKERLIDLTFNIDKGHKVYYERINVIGNTKTRDKVIRRELRIYEGELTNTTQLNYSKRRVTALGYFESVEFKTRRGSEEDLQIVDIEVHEKATGSFQVGAGFSSAENFIGTAQISQDNFLGRGQRISLQGQMSSIRQLFQAQFTEPYLLDTRWTLRLNAFNMQTQYSSFLRRSSGGDVTVGHPITDDIRVYLTYGLEWVSSEGGDGSVTQPAIASLNSEGRISSGKVTVTYDTRNNRLFPSGGMYHSVSAELSATWLGASENRAFHRYRGFARFYKRLFWEVVGKASLRLGFIRGLSDGGLPPSEKFILGGINSVRGYSSYTIGPERLAAYNDQGSNLYDPSSRVYTFVEGGDKEVLVNLELEFPIFQEVGIRGVLFLDAGNVYAEEENFFYLDGTRRGSQRRLDSDAFDYSSLPLGMLWGTGFGFRWMSPIGQLRFEWGFPLTKRPTDDSGPLFEFGIGNSF